MIRVSSELMEKLINLAGETSITRSRVEMGVHSFAQTVEEMGQRCNAWLTNYVGWKVN